MRVVYPKWIRGPAAVLAVLCIALVLMSSLVQAAHFHVSGQPDHECALCLAIHHVPRMAPAIGLQFSSRSISSLLPARALPLPARTFFFRLTTRPPPADQTVSA